MFGRKGRGPLGVLKSTSSKEMETKNLKNKADMDYVAKLRENLKTAAKMAYKHSIQVQDK